MELIFAGTNFRESKINAFRWYLFSQINTEFLQISLFYADFNGISEKTTFHGYVISRNLPKFAKLSKISAIKIHIITQIFCITRRLMRDSLLIPKSPVGIIPNEPRPAPVLSLHSAGF